jgi:type IV pilus assembly protein PilB
MFYSAGTVDLRDVRFTPELLLCVPPGLARRHRVLPVFDTDHRLRVAIADVSDVDGIISLTQHLQRELELCLVDEAQLNDFIEQLYGEA